MVVLTGASAGIGRSILDGLAREAFVVALSRTRAEVNAADGVWIRGDLEQPEIVAGELLEWLRTHERQLDGLIHCAGAYGANRRHDFLETTDAEWDEVMLVNARAQFILTTRLLPLLLTRERAFIVAISSNTATKPAPGRIAYGCSKAASYALFSGLAEELAATGVSVVQISPDRQVVTRGLMRRRSAGFDYSSYIDPKVFQEPVRTIVQARGAGMNGQFIELH